MPVQFVTMRLLTLLVVLSAQAATAPLAQAVPTASPPPSDARPSLGLAEAMAQLRRQNFAGALAAASRAGPVARDIIEWHRLRVGLGDFDEVVDFTTRNPDWPGMTYLKQQAEGSVPRSGRAPDVIAFFSDTQPRTGDGTVALVMAFRELGADGDAEAEAALAWLERSMTAEAERVLLSLYPDILTPLNEARLDSMLWDGATQAAQRAMARVDADQQALAKARMVLRS
ncbi:hypothetical protein LCGC14_1998810, partial [marine sediment metagenome]